MDSVVPVINIARDYTVLLFGRKTPAVPTNSVCSTTMMVCMLETLSVKTY